MGRITLALVLLGSGCGGAPVSPATPSEPVEQRADPETGPTEGASDESVRVAGPSSPEADAGPPAASAPERARIVVRSAQGRGTVVGWDGEREYEALGMPAVSEDGTMLVFVTSGGDGTNGTYTLVMASARTGTIERRDPLSESHASDEGTPDEVAHQQEARVQIAQAQRTLEERLFLPLAPLGEGTASGLALRDEGGLVEILDATGRSRFRQAMVPPRPQPPRRLRGDALDEWEMEHQCDDGLEAVEGWLIDATHVFLVLQIGATPDECWVRREVLVVTLPP